MGSKEEDGGERMMAAYIIHQCLLSIAPSSSADPSAGEPTVPLPRGRSWPLNSPAQRGLAKHDVQPFSISQLDIYIYMYIRSCQNHLLSQQPPTHHDTSTSKRSRPVPRRPKCADDQLCAKQPDAWSPQFPQASPLPINLLRRRTPQRSPRRMTTDVRPSGRQRASRACEVSSRSSVVGKM